MWFKPRDNPFQLILNPLSFNWSLKISSWESQTIWWRLKTYNLSFLSKAYKWKVRLHNLSPRFSGTFIGEVVNGLITLVHRNFGVIFLGVYWCCCGAVRVFQKFCGSDAVRCEILKIFWSWRGTVIRFQFFLVRRSAVLRTAPYRPVLGPIGSGSWIPGRNRRKECVQLLKT